MRKRYLRLLWIYSDLEDWWTNFRMIFARRKKIETGARFDPYRKYSKYLNETNTGLILDGIEKALSEKASYQNVCVSAMIGAGKTTRYVINNVLNRAKYNCSMVINDPK